MRNILLFLFLLPASTFGYAQTVNDIHLSEIDVNYMQIVGTAKAFSNKVTIEIDFGQKNPLWKSKDTQLKDADGKKLHFNSMIDTLSFFTKNGYEFVTAYAISNEKYRRQSHLFKNTLLQKTLF